MTTKLKIDLSQGILEVEGSETFVRAIYRDFKMQFLGEEAVEEGLHNSLVLEKGVREFRLAYLDPTSAEEIWEEEWDAKEKRMLPRAVRLSYRDAAGKNVRWVFPVMISVLAP